MINLRVIQFLFGSFIKSLLLLLFLVNKKMKISEKNERTFNTFFQRLITFSATGLAIGSLISSDFGTGVGVLIGAFIGIIFWLNETYKNTQSEN